VCSGAGRATEERLLLASHECRVNVDFLFDDEELPCRVAEDALGRWAAEVLVWATTNCATVEMNGCVYADRKRALAEDLVQKVERYLENDAERYEVMELWDEILDE
jgi:hypothetical protein